MKLKSIFLATLLITVLISCTKDDALEGIETQNSKIAQDKMARPVPINMIYM